jgi:hypothetical protein
LVKPFRPESLQFESKGISSLHGSKDMLSPEMLVAILSGALQSGQIGNGTVPRNETPFKPFSAPSPSDENGPDFRQLALIVQMAESMK